MFYQGVWGYICDTGYNWDMREAHILCKQMGYEKAFSEVTSTDALKRVKGVNFPFVISDIVCTGSEVSLRSCDVSVGDYCSGLPASILCSEKQQAGKQVMRTLCWLVKMQVMPFIQLIICIRMMCPSKREGDLWCTLSKWNLYGSGVNCQKSQISWGEFFFLSFLFFFFFFWFESFAELRF